MKSLLAFLFLTASIKSYSQITFDVNSDHVGFTDNFTMGELSHWTPLNLEFFAGDLGRTGTFNSNAIQFNNTAILQNTLLENGLLRFQEEKAGALPAVLQTRMSLSSTELKFINSVNWEIIKLYADGSNNAIADFKNASGATRTRIGTNGANFGFIGTYSAIGTNVVAITSRSGKGAVNVNDNNGVLQAGIYVDASNNGIVFGDTKSFRVKHPEKSNKEIWYASLEGPEVGAYDRGTAKLENGEVFIPFKDHFKHIANTKNMTVQLTPHEWDTYGLAVVEKTTEGFIVKELKGAKGNFNFDWEVKCVRVGKEKFQVVRSQDPNLSPANELPTASAVIQSATIEKIDKRAEKSEYCKKQ